MKIEKRIVTTKRHTIGYIVDGQRMTRGKVVKLARSGKIDGVTAKRTDNGWYVAARPSVDRPLYNIQTIIEPKKTRKAAK